MKSYSLRKSRAVFRHILRLYKRKKKHLSDCEKNDICSNLEKLQQFLISRDQEKASHQAQNIEIWAKTHLKKTLFEKGRDFIISIALALVIATLIRSMWFEFYEIPTGSMRPTLQEKDRLMVSKTTFGLNIPLKKAHFFFDPHLVDRLGIVVFTGQDLDIQDVNTRYFYLFPGKKQFVKRLIGKPGDTLYFYGGQVYGINEKKEDISQELQLKMLSHIEHIPFINFYGRILFPTRSEPTSLIFSQMNQQVAKIEINSLGHIKGELLPPYKNKIEDYFDLWGFKNYGMARLLTKQEASSFTDTPFSELEDTPYFLQIFHHPSIKHPVLQQDNYGHLYPIPNTNQTLLPLTESHLKILKKNLYTARFIVKDQKVSRYGSSIKASQACQQCPSLKNIPDGTYEFYHGKAYQVLFGGITKELPSHHPLYRFDFKQIQTLYNLGIEWLNYYKPQSRNKTLLPSRYVYYRKGNLYAMGALLMQRKDPILRHFKEKESLKKDNSSSLYPYYPFVDTPPPFTEKGQIDPIFLKKYGITVPSKEYLVLGDNYAMSADSRDFGFVPQDNLRGSPSFIFWPPGSRFGFLLQPSKPFFTLPGLIIWTLFGVTIIIWAYYHFKHRRLPIKID